MLVISSLISLVIGIGCGAFGFKNIYRKKFAAIGLSNKICYKANPGKDFLGLLTNVIICFVLMYLSGAMYYVIILLIGFLQVKTHFNILN